MNYEQISQEYGEEFARQYAQQQSRKAAAAPSFWERNIKPVVEAVRSFITIAPPALRQAEEIDHLRRAWDEALEIEGLGHLKEQVRLPRWNGQNRRLTIDCGTRSALKNELFARGEALRRVMNEVLEQRGIKAQVKTFWWT